MVPTTRGDFIATTNWFVPHVPEVHFTERIAIRNGLYLAAHIGSNKVEVELDCLFVVDSVVPMDNYLGHLQSAYTDVGAGHPTVLAYI